MDNKADVTIKAQAQSLKFMISNGLGLLFASSVTGYIFNHTVVDQGAAAIKQWQQFWIYPAVVAAVVALGFFLFFKDNPEEECGRRRGFGVKGRVIKKPKCMEKGYR